MWVATLIGDLKESAHNCLYSGQIHPHPQNRDVNATERTKISSKVTSYFYIEIYDLHHKSEFLLYTPQIHTYHFSDTID